MHHFTHFVRPIVAAAAFLVAGSCVCVAANTIQPQVWTETSLKRVWQTSVPADAGPRKAIPSGREQHSSFQAVVRNVGDGELQVECTVSTDQGIQATVRRVGFVPVPHRTPGVPLEQQDGKTELPGLVPDPLFPENTAHVGPLETQPFWISIVTGKDASAGLHTVTATFYSINAKDKSKTKIGSVSQNVEVYPFTLQKRKDFPVTHWWNPDAIYNTYHMDQFDERWWAMAAKYIRDMSDHGSNMVMVPVVHLRREVVSQPPQLLRVTETAPGKYSFDFSQVDRFIKLARANGIEYFEFPHLWLYWGVRNPMHVYQQKNGKWELLWPTETPATGEVYRNYLSQYLPALYEFLKQEHIDAEHAYFHLSDEPGGGEHIENYKKARALLRELAPWMKVMDALTNFQYGKQGLTDMPVVQLRGDTPYREAGIPHWVYYCTSPRGKYLNRFMDTPLDKLRMGGFLFYHLEAKGFLHWGYNYWYKIETQILIDPFQVTDSAAWPSIPSGDPFVVYPGPDGPIDSTRWEVFAESMQDYTVLQMAGIKPNDPMFEDLKAYNDFPYSEELVDSLLRKAMMRIPADK